MFGKKTTKYTESKLGNHLNFACMRFQMNKRKHSAYKSKHTANGGVSTIDPFSTADRVFQRFVSLKP